ncbi:hypothetical protein I4U23_019253 [Adineta vaga]|nr:hypothetical protein I4U23_019253 [Adineta vaga]
MLRSHFEFASVHFIIFILSVSSVYFGDFCSHELSCDQPLICSNTSRCVCPTLTSFWNHRQNTCLTCSHGWIEWNQEKCLLFIAPSDRGITHEHARDVCLTQSAQLLKIHSDEDFRQFEDKTEELVKSKHGNRLIEFLNNGVWIDVIVDADHAIAYNWCDGSNEGEIYPWNDCIFIRKQLLNLKNNTLLCLNHMQCNETLSYICEKSAFVDNQQSDVKYQERFIGMIGGLVSNLFFPTAATSATTAAAQIIYVTNPPQQILPRMLSNHSHHL